MGNRMTKAMAGAVLLGLVAAPARGERITFIDIPWAGSALRWEGSAWGLTHWKAKLQVRNTPQAGPALLRPAAREGFYDAAWEAPEAVAAAPKGRGAGEAALADLVRHVRFQPPGHGGFGTSWEPHKENAHVLAGRLAQAIQQHAPALGAFIVHGNAGIRDHLEDIRLGLDLDLSCFPEERPVFHPGHAPVAGTPAVPEPGTAALMALGLLGLAFLKRKSIPTLKR